MEINLKGKIILVTGASTGIGNAIAKSIAEANGTIVLHYNTNQEKADNLANAIGNQSKTFQANLEDPSSCIQLVKNVIDQYGKIDVLINNAGVAFENDLNSEDWIAMWDKTMAINLRAVGILCKELIPHFQKNGGGQIINIASRAAYRGETPEYLAYAASKGGVVSLGKSIARSYGKDNIKCYTIAPGFVRTEMAEQFIEKYGEEIAMKDLALQKLTEPKDLGPIITLLASGLADHATGTTIDLNAGSYLH